MRKTKILTGLIATGAIITPISFIGTSCSKTSTKSEIMSSDQLNIKNGVLIGFNPKTDLSKFTTLQIPEGVEIINTNAFKNALTAGKYKYGVNNNIKTIIFPSTLKTIYLGAFNGCTAIETLDFSKLSAENLNGIKMLTSETNNPFADFKEKGTIKVSSSASKNRNEFNTNIMVAGLPSAWVFENEVPNISESHIVDINDFHGAAPGFGDDFFGKANQHNPGAIRLAEETQKIINKYPGSVLLSAGDYEAGDPFSTCKHGSTFFPVLKAMDIRYSSLGNHSWEWGKEQLEEKTYDSLARTDDTVGNYFVNANVIQGKQFRDQKWDPNSENDYHLWNENRVKWVDPYKVVNMNGHDVCFIGLLTHDTLTDGNQVAIQDVSFMKKEDYLTAVTYTKKLAREEMGEDNFSKIESFILLTHCDSDVKDGKIVGESEYMARTATEASQFDAIISGHSHKQVCGTVHNSNLNKDIWVGQAGISGQRFVDTTIKFDDDKPVGKRLKSISMKLVKPEIAGEVITTGTPNYNKAHAQLEEISNNTIFPVVRNVVNVYNKQKSIAMADLQSSIGHLANGGLPYEYAKDPQIGTAYLQSEDILEPMGVWGTLSHLIEFNDHYKDQIAAGELFPACITLNNLDSYKAGFNISEGTEVIKKRMYELHPYENATAYGCITIDQLKQYINYMLDGGEDLFNYSLKLQYVDHDTKQPVKFYCDDAHQKEVEWSETETVSKYTDSDVKVPGVCPCPGVVQFYGVSFAIKYKCESTSKGNPITIYQLDDSKDIRIYTPWDKTNDINNPDTWTKSTDFATNSETHGYIPVLGSTFMMQGGNAQNRMLHHWFEYNEEQVKGQEWYKKLKSRSFDLLTRESSILYAYQLTNGLAPAATEPKALDWMITKEFCQKLLRRK